MCLIEYEASSMHCMLSRERTESAKVENKLEVENIITLMCS